MQTTSSQRWKHLWMDCSRLTGLQGCYNAVEENVSDEKFKLQWNFTRLQKILKVNKAFIKKAATIKFLSKTDIYVLKNFLYVFFPKG